MTGAADTIAVRSDEEMDWSTLADHLRRQIDGLDGPMVVEQFPGGHANLTYLVRFGGRELVVRRPPLGPIPKGGHDMGREYRVLSKLHRAYDRAPEAYHFCDDESVIGAPFLVTERRTGVVVRTDWPDAFKAVPDVERRTSLALIDGLADLHVVDAAAIELGDLGRPKGFVERQVSGWYQRWQAAKDKEIPVVDRVYEQLGRQLPENPTVSILHNDYKLDNCQFRADDPDRIHSVFDWDMATLGDPLVDLGTLLGYWTDPGEAMERGKMPAPIAGSYPRRAELIDRYLGRTGFSAANIGWYEAFALWKTAVVVQQIFIRFKRGQTQDTRFAEYDKRVPELVREAERILG
jgi:aminoglycoside phosphotransferase (APT) family kinase protein